MIYNLYNVYVIYYYGSMFFNIFRSMCIKHDFVYLEQAWRLFEDTKVLA